MIKIIKPEQKKTTIPHYYIQTDIMINDGDCFKNHIEKISDDDDFYISSKEAEMLVNIWNKLSQGKDDFKLCIDDWHKFFGNDEIKSQLRKNISTEDKLTDEEIDDVEFMYKKFTKDNIFNVVLDDEYNYLINISIKYIDEYGNIFNCEVV